MFHLRFPGDVFALLEQHGHVPLPPYIAHADEADDVRRYQTVFADRPGAVAAPTAALHFDDALLAEIAARGVQSARVTLHVGAGTFQPVRSDDLGEHKMHTEWFDVPQATVDAVLRTRAAGGRVVAIGTTTVRALESAAQPPPRQAGSPGSLQAGAGETRIFITPGYRFQVVDRLVTNFHLPKSTLMMLVSAFSGMERIRALYAHAIAQRYRFFSYGDAMLLDRVEPELSLSSSRIPPPPATDRAGCAERGHQEIDERARAHRHVLARGHRGEQRDRLHVPLRQHALQRLLHQRVLGHERRQARRCPGRPARRRRACRCGSSSAAAASSARRPPGRRRPRPG